MTAQLDPGPPALDLSCAFPAAGEAAKAFRRAGWTVATAESCTGGLLAAALAAAPEASAFFRGAVVAYAAEVKAGVLAVPERLLAEHGAVSGQVAAAMATGVCASLGADVGIAITGLVGDGDEGKPPGLTFIAVNSPWASVVVHLEGDLGPAANCERAVSRALDLSVQLARRAALLRVSA